MNSENESQRDSIVTWMEWDGKIHRKKVVAVQERG